MLFAVYVIGTLRIYFGFFSGPKPTPTPDPSECYKFIRIIICIYFGKFQLKHDGLKELSFNSDHKKPSSPFDHIY